MTTDAIHDLEAEATYAYIMAWCDRWQPGEDDAALAAAKEAERRVLEGVDNERTEAV